MMQRIQLDASAECDQQIYSFYRKLYKCLGQLAYKKGQKLADINKRVLDEHMKLEISIDTFDPQAKAHSMRKNDLYKAQATTEDEIKALENRMQDCRRRFSPCGVRLDAAGIEWIDPEHEVQEASLNRRAEIVEYKAHLCKSPEARIQQERHDIEQARLRIADRQSPKAGGNTSPRLISG
jgi:hypothetical protein